MDMVDEMFVVFNAISVILNEMDVVDEMNAVFNEMWFSMRWMCGLLCIRLVKYQQLSNDEGNECQGHPLTSSAFDDRSL